ncbi:hypothetical protein ACIBI9_56110 [Nonomuraea sp. NPDC050451]|uniref:hypothetical protein n=1 Tax=Nonomuraea sp. NPDC050451 TaxID=3364364 RepID=UPI0037BBE5CE
MVALSPYGAEPSPPPIAGAPPQGATQRPLRSTAAATASTWTSRPMKQIRQIIAAAA